MLVRIVDFHIGRADIVGAMLFCSLRVNRIAGNASALLQILIDLRLFLFLVNDPAIITAADLHLVAIGCLKFPDIAVSVVCAGHLLNKVRHFFVVHMHLIILAHRKPRLNGLV